MTSFRQLLEAGRAARYAEAEFRAEQWGRVREVAARVVERPAWSRTAWDRAMHAVVDPTSVRPAPAADAIGRSWDRALAEFANCEPARASDGAPGRLIVKSPGRSQPRMPAGSAALARGWDHALAEFRVTGET